MKLSNILGLIGAVVLAGIFVFIIVMTPYTEFQDQRFCTKMVGEDKIFDV